MTIEQLNKMQDLLKTLNDITNTQHKQIMEIKTIIQGHADWLLEQVKEIRDAQNA